MLTSSLRGPNNLQRFLPWVCRGVHLAPFVIGGLPRLVVLPLGLFIALAIFDALYLWRDNTALAVVAYWNIAGGSVAGWLGGELVDRLAVGVDDGAHLDAPSSLSGRPASQHASADVPVRHRRAS